MSQPDENRIEELLGQMTFEEKAALCHAASSFTSGSCERLGVPGLTMSDGPHGVRHEIHPRSWEHVRDADDESTYLPTGSALAATWDPQLALAFGKVLGAEARDRGKDVILGPSINIVRTPLCGRNFEYMSEDPLLTGRMAAEYVRGVQSNDVAACPKHYALNNQELDRFHVDVEVDDRTLREIYLPAFRSAVVDGGAWSVMGAYNKYRGQHCCHNRRLLNEILKDEWRFDGVVVSDWGGVHDTDEAARNGLDIEMGGPADPEKHYLGRAVVEAHETGELPDDVLDDKVRRILRTMYRVGLLGDEGPQAGARNTEGHRAAAREIARRAVVLLKNDGGVLPLDPSKIHTLAVIGPNADTRHGERGGSSQVRCPYEVTPLEGLRNLLGDGVEMIHVPAHTAEAEFEHPPVPAEKLGVTDSAGIVGWRGEYFDNRRFAGEPVEVRTDQQPQAEWGGGRAPAGLPGESFSVRWSATFTPHETGEHEFAIYGPDCTQLYVDGLLVINMWGDTRLTTRTAKVGMEGGREYRLVLQVNPKSEDGRMRFGHLPPSAERTPPDNQSDEALAAARKADAVVFVGGLDHTYDTEGADRYSLALPGAQDELIASLVEANPDTVVCLVAGSAVAMPWADEAPAIIWAWYNGQEAGTALAEVLLGRVSPSGKLPVTLPRRLEDVSAHAVGEYAAKRQNYRDGVFVGYRHFDATGIEPPFPFGHGLSYTTFEMSDLFAEADGDTVHVRVNVTNAGDLSGAEVVQLYVGQKDPPVDRPSRELRDFARVELAPGQTETVTFELQREALAYYDADACEWRTTPGRYTAWAGGSSRDLPVTADFELA